MVPLVGGIMDLRRARRIAEACKDFGVETIKITGAQRLVLLGIKEEEIDKTYDALGVRPQVGGALCQQ